MVHARRKGMTNGEYVYIVSTLSDISLDLDFWWMGISGRLNKTEVEKAWHSVLTLVPRPYNMTKYGEFQKQVIEKINKLSNGTNDTQGQVSAITWATIECYVLNVLAFFIFSRFRAMV